MTKETIKSMIVEAVSIIGVIVGFVIIALFYRSIEEGALEYYKETIMYIAIIVILLAVVLYIILSNRKPKLKNVTNEFEIIYQDLLKFYTPELQSKKRKGQILKNVITLILFVLFVIAFYMMNETGMRLGIVIFGVIIIGWYNLSSDNKAFDEAFKREIISRLLKAINPTLEYKGDEGYFLKDEYKRVDFGDDNIKKVELSDYITGKLEDGTDLLMADLTVDKEVEEWDEEKNEYKKHKVTVFKGIFAKVNCNKYITEQIKITDNFILKQNKPRIEFSDTEFEKMFDVYTRNEDMTRRILSDYLMERLIAIKKEYGVGAEIVIQSGCIYMRIHIGGAFEPTKNPMSKTSLYTDYCIVKTIIEIMTEIKKSIESV